MWPDGAKVASSPPAVYWAAEISRRLSSALAGRSKSAVARDAAIARSTLYDVLGGETWPDLATIVALEEVLDVTLWPGWAPGATGPAS